MNSCIGALALLFGASFMAATVIPSQSEWILFWQLKEGLGPAWALLLAATAGNVLGAWVNWWLGKWAARFQDRKWFPLTPAQMQKAQDRFNRYGRWSLLLAWVPFVGDPLTVAAGALNVPQRVFLPLVTVGKGARYLFVWAVYQGFF